MKQRNARVVSTKRLVYQPEEGVPGNPYMVRFSRIPFLKDTINVGRRGRGMESQMVIYFGKDMQVEKYFGDGLPKGVDVVLRRGSQMMATKG